MQHVAYSLGGVLAYQKAVQGTLVYQKAVQGILVRAKLEYHLTSYMYLFCAVLNLNYTVFFNWR